MTKLIKYEKLISLCFAKLTSIQDKISKALSDGKISDEKFRLVSEEDRNYELQGSDILKKENFFYKKVASFNRRNSENNSKSKKIEINWNIFVNNQRIEPSAPPDYEF